MADNVSKKPKPVVSLGEVLRDASLRPDELTKSREELLKESKREIYEGLHLTATGSASFLRYIPRWMEMKRPHSLVGYRKRICPSKE